MSYGTIKVDNIVFTNSGVDQTIGVSGLVQSVSGNLTVTGTISGNLIRGTTVSGATITGSVLSVTSGLFTSGVVGAPTIGFAGDGNTGFWSPAGDTVALSTNGSERIRVDADGDLGVGTTDPTSRLTVRSDATSGPNTIIRVENRAASAGVTTQNIKIEGIFDYNNGTSDASAGAILFGKEGTYTTATTANDSYLAFETVADNSSAERVRIDSSGRLLVGTSTTSQNTIALLQGNSTNPTGNGALYLARGSATPADGNGLGQLSFSDSGHVSAVNIVAARDGGTWTSGVSQPARLMLSTTADGAASSTERMRITSAGLVGIGTSSPGYALDVNGTGSFSGSLRATSTGTFTVLPAGISGSWTGSGFALQSESNTSPIGFLQGASERARIDSSGRLLVGTSTALTVFNYRQSGGNLGSLQAVTVGAGANTPTFANFAAATYAQQLSFVKSRGTTIGDYAIVADGDNLGSIYFFGADGVDVSTAGAAIISQVDGTPGANDMPGRLVFSTTADGAAIPTERMRIDSTGLVTIGNPSGGLDGALGIRRSSDGLPGGGLRYQTADSALRLYNNGGSGNLDFALDSASTLGTFRFFAGGSGTTELMRIDGATGNVGIGVIPSSTTRLITEANANTIIPFQVGNTNNNFDTNPTVTQTVARLVRNGKPGFSFSSAVDFGISRYENVSTNARTQLDIKLANGLTSTPEVTVMSLRSSGDIVIGAGGNILADFSNATITSRTYFQTSTANLSTVVGAIPNGTNVTSAFYAFNNSTPTNSSYGGVFVDNTRVVINSSIVGTGTYLPMVFQTNNQEQARFTTTDRYFRMAAGTGGIQFNGDTAAANALDDYEEGTWTPAIAGGTTTGTGTYSRQVGRYMKLGNRIFVEGIVTWSAHTGTGSIRISGLPFVVQNTTNYYSAAALYSSTITSPANTVLQAYAAFGQSQILIASVPVAGGTAASLAMDTAGEFLFSVNYII